MATIVSSTPTSTAGNALFNWDEFGYTNFKFSGTVNVSTSNCFSLTDYFNNTNISYTYAVSTTEPMPTRSQALLDNIDIITGSISKFGNIAFSKTVDYANTNPAAVGSKSDINIFMVTKTGVTWAGITAVNNDNTFGYAYSRSDISLNFLSNYQWNLSLTSALGNTLMHEVGHAIGMSHPFRSHDVATDTFVYTSDFSKTVNMGFDKLGFHINSVADMDKQYFTMMSYDQQFIGTKYVYGLAPMVLDILAIQNVYGEGAGTSGTGNDIVAINTTNYNSFFDLGGTDTLDLAYYTSGVYVNMGTTISGSLHLVGVAMSYSQGENLLINGVDPTNLNWLVGEYENAWGSVSRDKMIGNSLNNAIYSYDGNDYIDGGDGNDDLYGGYGNDLINGGAGTDTAHFTFDQNSYRIYKSGDNIIVKGTDGRDILSGVEQLQFGSSAAVSVSSLSSSLKYNFVQNDFDGDGNSDVLWRNPSNNLMGTWSINGNQYTWNQIGQAGGTLTIAGTGDFNRDGSIDVLWQDASTNTLSLWTMNNGVPTNLLLGSGSTTMQVAGIGDFNGDGSSDILWQNPNNNMIGIWSIQNGQYYWVQIGLGSTTMKMAGTGDFNGDGTSDILWINPTNNLLGVWSMQNNVPTWSLIGQGSTTMNIAGIGDFNGDGTSDILWLNSSNNLVGLWSMNDNAPNWSLVGQGSTTMNIASIGDYNGDGTSDVLWLNPTNNLLGTWSMNNNAPTWSLIGGGSTTMKVV